MSETLFKFFSGKEFRNFSKEDTLNKLLKILMNPKVPFNFMDFIEEGSNTWLVLKTFQASVCF